MNTAKISGTNPDIRPLVQQAINDGVLPPQADWEAILSAYSAAQKSSPPRNLKSTFAEMLDVYMGRSEPPVHDFMRDVIEEAERRVANGDFGLGAPIPRADGGIFRPDLRPNRKQRRAEAATFRKDLRAVRRGKK